MPQIWSKQQEEVRNCTLKQVTLEWKGCSWPRALSWQLFLSWWRPHPKVVQDPCENGVGSWIFVLRCWEFMSPDFMVSEESSLFQTALIRGTKKFLMKIISFSQIAVCNLWTCVCSCGTVLERNSNWSLVLGKKTNRNSDVYIFIQISVSLCYQAEVSKGFKPSGISDVMSRYI